MKNCFINVYERKVRVITSSDLISFEKIVNNFKLTHRVVDIQYRPVATERVVYHNAMIIYEEEKNDI